MEVLVDQSLWLRISATNWADGVWNLGESVRLAKIVKKMGIAVIYVSSAGCVRHQQIPVAENYQVPFAESIKKESEILTDAVGLIKKAIQTEAIL